jgi:hypothetical protein
MTEKEIFLTALHESGHAFAASAFRIASYPMVTPEQPMLAHSAETVNGICYHDRTATPYQRAVIGWGGLLSVCMFGEPPEYAPPFKPSTLKQLRLWHDMVLARFGNLSSTDRAMIGGYKRLWQSCRATFLILSKNASQVKWLARHLAADAEKQQATLNESVPMLELFEKPESLELPDRQQVLKDFLSRMSADDPARPKFQRWLACLERGELPPEEIVHQATN